MPSPDEAKQRARKIRAYHKRTGMSQRAVGEHFGVSAATVNTALKAGRKASKRKPRRKQRKATTEPAQPIEDHDPYQRTLAVFADLQTALRQADKDGEGALAARIRRDMVPVLRELRQSAPDAADAAGVTVDPMAMMELGRAAMTKLRDYADRAREELLDKVRDRKLSSDALEVLRLVGVLPAVEGETDG